MRTRGPRVHLSFLVLPGCPVFDFCWGFGFRDRRRVLRTPVSCSEWPTFAFPCLFRFSRSKVGALHGIESVDGVAHPRLHGARIGRGHEAVTEAGQWSVAVDVVEYRVVSCAERRRQVSAMGPNKSLLITLCETAYVFDREHKFQKDVAWQSDIVKLNGFPLTTELIANVYFWANLPGSVIFLVGTVSCNALSST